MTPRQSQRVFDRAVAKMCACTVAYRETIQFVANEVRKLHQRECTLAYVDTGCGWPGIFLRRVGHDCIAVGKA